MIRYRQLTDVELAEIAGRAAEKPAVKKSTVKKRHYTRQDEKPPRKVAGRHAAKRTP